MESKFSTVLLCVLVGFVAGVAVTSPSYDKQIKDFDARLNTVESDTKREGVNANHYRDLFRDVINEHGNQIRELKRKIDE